jgi:RNA-binding protein YhbY
MTFAEMQLGKNGITENFIQTLKACFQKHDSVRVSVLKSAGHDKNKIKEYSEEILEKLGNHYTAKLIGFKIVVKKWRKAIKR